MAQSLQLGYLSMCVSVFWSLSNFPHVKLKTCPNLIYLKPVVKEFAFFQRRILLYTHTKCLFFGVEFCQNVKNEREEATSVNWRKNSAVHLTKSWSTWHENISRIFCDVEWNMLQNKFLAPLSWFTHSPLVAHMLVLLEPMGVPIKQ
jgi:hypothetical protein